MAYTRRFERSRSDKMVSGVAGGMAEYFEIDAVFVRLGWVASVFLTGGISILVYIVMIFVVPQNGHTAPRSPDVIPQESEEPGEDPVKWEVRARERRERARNWLAIGLIVAGVVLLMYNLDILGPIDWGIASAIAIIGIGAALLFISIRRRR